MGKKPAKSVSEFPAIDVEVDLSEFEPKPRGRPTVKLKPVELERLTRACK